MITPAPHRSTVATAGCGTYERDAVKTAVDTVCTQAGDLFGGVRRGDVVFIKINHLGEHPVERAINTHPEILAAVLQQLLDRGAKVTVGDCLDHEGIRPFETSGHREACNRFGLEPVNLRTVDFVHVDSPGAIKVPSPLVSKAVADADHVVNLPKLKAHLLSTLTLSIKNMYGVFPHKVRHQYHREYPAYRDFAEMLVDLYGALRPTITVMDGIIALEGMGPGRKGKPRPVGVVLASSDGVACDAVASAIVKQNPRRIDTTRIAANRGLGLADLDRIDVIGPAISELAIDGFKIPTGALFATNLMDRFPPVAAQAAHHLAMSVREIPELITDKCTGCGDCVGHCPEDAITMVRELPVIALKSCVPCFACVEFCPESALERSWNPLGRLAMKAATRAMSTRRAVKRMLGLRKSGSRSARD